MSFTAGMQYLLNYLWTDKNKGPQHAQVSALFTGKIFVIGNVEFGEFIHQSNGKIRHLSLAMLENMTAQLDRVIEEGATWGEEA
jgi:hypothetical protein